MKPADTDVPALIGPTPTQFADLFPFHLAVDRSDRIVQVGHALAALVPGLRPGVRLDEHARINRPEGVSSLAMTDAEQRRSLFILRLDRLDLLLRGQVIELPGEHRMFLGSPWITHPEEIQQLGISSDTFAIHDASLDLIHAIQAQRMAAADHQRLVERLKQQRAELQQTNAMLRAREAETSKLALVASRTHSAVVITDRLGRIEWVNQGFTRLTGYLPAEVQGRVPGHFLQGPDTNRETVEFMQRKLALREGFHAEVLNYGRDGKRYWVEIEVQPVVSDAGEVTNFIAIEQDITSRVEDERRRQLQQSVSMLVAEADSLEQGILSVLRSVGKAVDAGFGGCWPVEKQQLQPTPFNLWTDGRLGRDAAADLTMDTLRDRLSPVLHEDRPVYLEGPGGTDRLLAIPCRAEGRVVAKIILAGDRLAAPTPEMLRLLDSLGSLIGQFTVRTLGRRELQRSRDFALQVMNLMGQGLSVTDDKGRFTFVNEAYAQAVGIPREELIGKEPTEISPVADQALLAEVRRQRVQGKASSYEIRLTRPNGETMPVLVTGVPRMEKGKFMGTIAVITDLTAQKRVEQQFELALARERELNTLKSSFVTMASHEFRTPLTGIVYAAEMMASHVKALPEATGARQQRYLDIILDGAKRMSDLMNDLLLLGRIESGKLACAPAEVELHLLLDELRRQVSGGQERIEIRIAPGSPVQVLVDSNLLCHALLNLLSNALKYSPAPRPVILAAEAEQPATGPGRLCFSVTDSGCGIPLADQEKLFQPFFRATNVGKIRGTGIGLTIARDCARLHGGELTFVSEAGQGTTFRVAIPLLLPGDSDPAGIASGSSAT